MWNFVLLLLKLIFTTNLAPQSIAEECEEYGQARYITKTIYPPPLYRPENKVFLDCENEDLLLAGGTSTRLKEFPHMAIIGYNNHSESPKDAEWNCDGSLISDRFVLSAAHCIRNKNESLAKWVRLGDLVINNDGDEALPKDFRIIDWIVHPKYNSSFIDHDIMLLKLNDSVIFTPYIRPICLYVPTHFLLPVEAIITGWANTNADSKSLVEEEVIFSNGSIYFGNCSTADCTEKFQNGFSSENMICAHHEMEVTWEENAGGPLQVRVPNETCMYAQIGIILNSFSGYNKKNKPSVHTKVEYYIPWIQSIVWP